MFMLLKPPKPKSWSMHPRLQPGTVVLAFSSVEKVPRPPQVTTDSMSPKPAYLDTPRFIIISSLTLSRAPSFMLPALRPACHWTNLLHLGARIWYRQCVSADRRRRNRRDTPSPQGKDRRL